VRQKHPDALVDRRRSRVKALVPVGGPGEGSIPPADLEMPEGLHTEAQRIWNETVTFAHHHLYSPDGLALRRWIHWVSEWWETTEQIALEGVVVRGKRESRLNPRVRYLRTCEEHIARGETVMGFNPLARMRLGITFAMEQSALAGLKGGQPTKPTLMDPEQARKPRSM
jgi:P27 family predicted phage terminase small subunit